jgi:2-methylcitrate dehydratase PrpD
VRAARIADTTPILSVWQSCYDGATTRNAYTGNASRAGVRASTLARAKFSRSAAALDFAFGTVAGQLHDEPALTRGLNYDDFAILHNYVKMHSSCALSHSAIEVALELHGHPLDTIDRIEVDTVALNLKIDCLPEFDNRYPDAAPARVTVVAPDGARATATVHNPRGHCSRPLPGLQGWDKFATLVADPVVAEVWWSRPLALWEIPDCATLEVD